MPRVCGSTAEIDKAQQKCVQMAVVPSKTKMLEKGKTIT